MELRVIVEMTADGPLFRVIGTGGCSAAVLARTGDVTIHGDRRRCRVTEAMALALSEWYQADRAHYQGANAAKVERRLLLKRRN